MSTLTNPGTFPQRSGTHGKQNLSLVVAESFVARPVNKRINAGGDEIEKCEDVVKLCIQLGFSRPYEHLNDLVWGQANHQNEASSANHSGDFPLQFSLALQ